MRKVALTLSFSMCLMSLPTVAADMNLLKNDKEVSIMSFTKNEQKRISDLFKDESLNKKLSDLFYRSLESYMSADNLKCEMQLPNYFENYLYQQGLSYTEADLLNYYKMLRVNNYIDDLLYEIARDTTVDMFALRNINNKTPPSKGISTVKRKLLEVNDLNDHYSNFQSWPDENNLCAYQEFIHLKNIVFDESEKLSKDPNDLKYLTGHALYKGIISQEVYHKLEYLRTKSTISKRELWLQDYLKIIFNAKNKMVPEKKIYAVVKFDQENKFSTEWGIRKERLTRRKLLYLKYDQTQIIQLAQVLEKASRRMGTDPDTKTSAPTIVQEFEVLKNGQTRTYVEKLVLDPQSQYVYARNMMRKDMVNLQMMDSFKRLKVTYEDVVMAAYETGYINNEDIEFVIKYDDLWNPTKTKTQKIFGFVFDVAGYTTFVLPPPWNIAAAIVLGITEGIVDSKFESGADHDNPGTIF